MQMSPIATRIALAAALSGEGVELGVARGDYSLAILGNVRVTKLHSVDRWSDHHDEREYRKAADLLSVFGSRSAIVRASFCDALGLFPDASLDFVYIDGYAHTGQDGGRTLADWWPKLKPGGMFAGHDYHPRYQPTIDVVDAFMASRGLQFGLTEEDELPSWWTIKP